MFIILLFASVLSLWPAVEELSSTIYSLALGFLNGVAVALVWPKLSEDQLSAIGWSPRMGNRCTLRNSCVVGMPFLRSFFALLPVKEVSVLETAESTEEGLQFSSTTPASLRHLTTCLVVMVPSDLRAP